MMYPLQERGSAVVVADTGHVVGLRDYNTGNIVFCPVSCEGCEGNGEIGPEHPLTHIGRLLEEVEEIRDNDPVRAQELTQRARHLLHTRRAIGF